MIFLYLACLFASCAPVIVRGQGVTVSEIDLAIDVVASEAGVEREVFSTRVDPFIVTYSTEPHPRYGNRVVGVTELPRRAWVLRDAQRKDLCTDATVHELIHTLLWKTNGDPDRQHHRTAWWTQTGSNSLEARSIAKLCALLGRPK